MAGTKEIGVVLGVTSILAGCLFPSFDDLGGGTDPVRDGGAADTTTSADAGGDATSNQAPPSSPQTQEAGTPPPITVACGAAGQCDLSIEACCFTFGGPDCQPLGAAGTCGIQGSGHHFSCDGAEDCTGGDVCCYVPTEKKATCKAATACSGGKILCNGPRKLCGENQGSCTGTLSIPSEPPTKYWTCE